MSTQRRIDDKGRLTIPSEIRERLGLDPGATVSVELDDGEVVIRPDVDRGDVAERLNGCINRDTRTSDPPDFDPEDTKEMWTSDLP